MQGSTVLLGVTGSVAAYRAADIASLLTRQGAKVDVILTGEAEKFVRPLLFESLTGRKAFTDRDFGILDGKPIHIALAERARLAVVAPATADVLGKLAHGLAPDLLTSTLLAIRCPLIIAPAMNGNMWFHAAVQENVRILTERGVRWLGPDQGVLACGHVGLGRLWPAEEIASQVFGLWKGKEEEPSEKTKKETCQEGPFE
ncbi:flavoprotein [Candidatus Methylacidithermus pantelleriae]|uniref:Phosphopantothenoylcysteine decarboxylase n=1 Tax=Candidatus Methylacidithermus pantelleriae TaxID=2744239 RepID=A0A8J2BLJ6_9BACT|nr:flavoprotein [Candidatus Methylacidithermus pantelleriae]CAF0689150.1 Phosphopantothenoylcysteine decarboxylase [Candidatus Methylacidithermus pantelleriae]